MAKKEQQKEKIFNMEFVVNYIRNSSLPIHFIKCKDEKGEDCYYFLMSSEQKVNTIKNNPPDIVNLSDYGIIVHSGYGVNPSDEEIELLRKKYNYSSY